MASLGSVTAWADECDVLVLGYGLAGCVTAMTAYDADPWADILICEKMPERYVGGNSRASGQSIVFPEDIESWKQYHQALNHPNPVPQDVLDAWSAERVGMEDWVRQIAANAGMRYDRGRVRGEELKPPIPEFPEMPGSHAIHFIASIHPRPSGVWNAFKANADTRPLRTRFETKVVDLVQDPDTLEVYGAIVEHNGERMAIKGRRATVMCTGGFGNNPQMQRDYFGLDVCYSAGTPGNTGDGIKILQKAGADMWHLRNWNQSGGIWPAFRPPGFESAFIRNLEFRDSGFLEIGRDHQRFYDESFRYSATHYRTNEHGVWLDTFHWRVLPVHLIFDDQFRRSDRLTLDTSRMTWNLVVENYEWSEDNSKELAAGWILRADTVAELAEKMGRPVDEVEATVRRYNQSAAEGFDAEHKREPGKMRPLAGPPYYAIEVVPTIVATTGGGRRNGKAQVVSIFDSPIPRLYEAGELGSTHANLYQNGSFLTEAMAFGRIAGRNAVAEAPWE